MVQFSIAILVYRSVSQTIWIHLAVFITTFPHLPVPFFRWNQGSSYLIYWRLRAWLQICKQMEEEGFRYTKRHGTLKRFQLHATPRNFIGIFCPSLFWEMHALTSSEKRLVTTQDLMKWIPAKSMGLGSHVPPVANCSWRHFGVSMRQISEQHIQQKTFQLITSSSIPRVVGGFIPSTKNMIKGVPLEVRSNRFYFTYL